MAPPTKHVNARADVIGIVLAVLAAAFCILLVAVLVIAMLRFSSG